MIVVAVHVTHRVIHRPKAPRVSAPRGLMPLVAQSRLRRLAVPGLGRGPGDSGATGARPKTRTG